MKCEMQTSFYKAMSHISEALCFVRCTLDEVLSGLKERLSSHEHHSGENLTLLIVPFSFNTAIQAIRQSKAQWSGCTRLREESLFSQPFQPFLKSIIASNPEMMPTMQNFAGFSIMEAAAVPVCWIRPVLGRQQWDGGALRCKACKLGG